MPGVMLSLDMGCGKSYITIAVIQNGGFMRTLILAPKTVVESVWAKQFATHATQPMIVLTLGGHATSKKKAQLAAERMAEAGKKNMPFVCVVNYETARQPDFADWSLRAGFDCVVFDESHKIKAHNGAASKYCARLAKSAPWKIALTGTPMPHSPLDVFAQYRALDPSVFGTSYFAFRSKYAKMGGYLAKQVVGFQNLEELNNRFYSIAFRVQAGDVLDLPEVRHEQLECELGASAAKLYAELSKELVAEVEEGVVSASNALAKLLRLQQITSGFAKLDESGYEKQVDTAKADVLADLIDGLDAKEPLVVFCRFHHDLAVIEQAAADAERPYAELSGRNAKGVLKLQDWQEGKASILGVQIQSGGVGIDLTRARYAVYYSLGFSLGDYEQSLARIHRPGQAQPVVYYHILAKNTVDEKVYKALRDRKNVVEAVLAEIRDDD